MMYSYNARKLKIAEVKVHKISMSFQAIYRSDLKFLDFFYQKRFVLSKFRLSRRRLKFVLKILVKIPS